MGKVQSIWGIIQLVCTCVFIKLPAINCVSLLQCSWFYNCSHSAMIAGHLLPHAPVTVLHSCNHRLWSHLATSQQHHMAHVICIWANVVWSVDTTSFKSVSASYPTCCYSPVASTGNSTCNLLLQVAGTVCLEFSPGSISNSHSNAAAPMHFLHCFWLADFAGYIALNQQLQQFPVRFCCLIVKTFHAVDRNRNSW